MTGKEVSGIVFRGVERAMAPSLSEDGGALESFNLRPTGNGMELALGKKLSARVSIPAEAGVSGKPVSFVYRHHALPRGSYLIVFGNKAFVSSGTSLMRGNDGGIFSISYEEDISNMGELGNVLVVRTKTRQDFWLWSDGKYSRMPAVRMPSEMILEQEFDKESPESPSKNPFFGAVVGFKVPVGAESPNGFDEAFEENKESALQYVQEIRAEEESRQRKIGKFVGHVLVRCAFKTAQDNYISYGPVLHAEIGSYAQCTKTSRFPRNDEEDEELEWHQRLYAKMIDDALGDDKDTIVPDGAQEDVLTPLWPVSALRNVDTTRVEHPSFTVSHNGRLPNAGFSQPPVFVGAVPYAVYMGDYFRAEGSDGDNEIHEDSGSIRLGSPDEYGNSDADRNDPRYAIGVYSPGIVYSYPVLKVRFDKETIEALRFYKENNIVQGFCVAMTAPVKHGFGTNLVKVNRIPFGVFKDMQAFYWQDGNRVFPDKLFKAANPLDDSNSDRKNDDCLYVYGYPRNIDSDPERLMDSPFYIVKDISLEELLADAKEGEVYEIPLQLKDIGVVETVMPDGTVQITVTEDAVSNAQGEQVDPDYVSLSNIENAKALPTDNFSCHTFLGGSYMEYNRRLHLFGVETILFEGYSPSPFIQRDQKGYGRNDIGGSLLNLYWEAVIKTDRKNIVVRHPVERYMYADGNRNHMVLPDLLTYPDYRCKTMRLIREEGGKRYNVSGDIACKNSVLNNLAYVAFTTKDIEELAAKAGLRFSCSHGLTLGYVTGTRIDNAEGASSKTLKFNKGISLFVLKEYAQAIDIGKYGYAYAPDDTLAYCDKVVDIGKPVSEYPEADYTGMEEGGVLEDSNRVQVSGTDDVFFYPSANSYRFGSLDNRIIAADSVYGQVTEQKFGMFPLYVFTEEGIFTMEQGTGDILYIQAPKVNDDRVTGAMSLCNVGNGIAYVADDGLHVISGKESALLARHVDGEILIELDNPSGAFSGIVSDFAETLSRKRFLSEIKGAGLFFDIVNNELMMIPSGSYAGKRPMWAFSMSTGQAYKQSYDLNSVPSCGIVQGIPGLAWNDVPDFSGSHTLHLYDFRTPDKTPSESALRQPFLYVSGPLKMGSPGYKRVEHSVMRLQGTGIELLEVLYFGSLDGIKWFQMGGGRMKNRNEATDFTMRRMPCSVRYLVVAVRGKASYLQLLRLDAEVRMKYAGKLR